MSESKVKELEAIIQKKDKELNIVKSHCTLLEKTFLNLETEYSFIKASYNSIVSKENYFKNLELKFYEKDDQIFKLNQEIQSLATNFQKQRLESELQYEKDVNQIKYFHENNIAKLEYANKVESQCKMLYNHIRELEEVILNYNNEEKKRFKEREVKFEKELAEIKKKMLDYIKEGHKKGFSFNSKQQELNSKLNRLHNNQLLNELEFQSIQIENLLKQRDHFEKVILELKNDNAIHAKVEKNLTEKNKKYTEIIKMLSMKKIPDRKQEDQKDNNNDKDNKGQLLMPLCVKETDKASMTMNQLRVNSVEMNQCSRFKKGKELLFSQDGNSNTNTNGNNNLMNQEGFRAICLQKELMKKQSDCNKLKCSLYKYKGMEHRFRNLFYLFEETLEKVYNDPQFTKVKEIYVNLEEFKTCEFSLMTQEQKYSALVLLIDYILPLINKDIIASERVKKSLDRVEKKFVLSKDESVKTYTSLADTKTSNHSTKNIRFKSANDFLYNMTAKKSAEKPVGKIYSLLKI